MLLFGTAVKFDRVCRVIRQVIYTAFFSCAEPNANIMIIKKSSGKFSENLLRMLVRFYEEEAMAKKDLQECKLCKRLTK